MDTGQDGWRKAWNPTRHSNATITTKQYWFRYSVDVASVCDSVDSVSDSDDGGGIVLVFAFRWCRSFFPAPPRMPKINFVHTLSVNINKRKSLMNSAHAYVLHSVPIFFFFSGLHYFPVSYGWTLLLYPLMVPAIATKQKIANFFDENNWTISLNLIFGLASFRFLHSQ